MCHIIVAHMNQYAKSSKINPQVHQPSSHPAGSNAHANSGLADKQCCPQPRNSQSHYARGSPAYTPQSNGLSPHAPRALLHSSDTAKSDLAKYLARSQLVSSGLTRFDDKPENYLSWKSSFIKAIESLDLKAGEEMDLLIRWLGTNSAEHARCIKSVNVRNPSAWLYLIWERLEEMYGLPEAIALFTKLEKFPNIAPKEHHKLIDLSDLLSAEIESAKQEGYLPGISYLDTVRGINPIVEKLPYGLQDKWMMEGSRYKHLISFQRNAY